MSCLVLRFSRKLNKSRVLSWLTGTKHQSLKNKRILSSTYFSRCESKSLKNIAPEPQSIFSKTKNCFPRRSQKSKTPGLSFSSKKNRLSFPPTLSQKKSPNPGLRLCSKKIQSPKRDFRVYMKYLKVNKWFCLTHYHLISYWNNDYEHTCTSNQLLDSLQVKIKPMTVL